MKKFTNVIYGANGAEKIERHENELDAVLSAWEQKMSGKTVKVVNDETCETIYR